MIYRLPIKELEGAAQADRYCTLCQVELLAFGRKLRLRELTLSASFADEAQHNCVVWIARGLAGTASEELAAAEVQKIDTECADAVLRMRSRFLTEPYSEVRDLLEPIALPDRRTVRHKFGGLRREGRAMEFASPYALRLLAGARDDARATFSGAVGVEII